jgi:magnesium-dependent phosphatase 1
MSHPDSTDRASLPELVVFDLDFTLWDCDGAWCDCLRPPFQRDQRNDQVVDGDGRVVKLYNDVLQILDQCDQAAIPMALASRTEQPTWAGELVELLGIADRFLFAEIYPTTTLKHFAALQKDSDVEFERMIFFDDEMRNIREVSTLGVTSIHVAAGMTNAVYQMKRLRCQEPFAANSHTSC